MSLQSIKLVTLDVTNTILKFRSPPWQHYAAVAQEFGYTVDAQQVKTQMIGSFKTLDKQHPNYGRDSIRWVEWWRRIVRGSFAGLLPATADVGRLADRLIQEYKTRRCWARAAGGDALLALLRRKQMTVGVISNYDPRLYDLLENLSYGKQLDFIITSYDAGHTKPHQQIFNLAMRHHTTPISPAECLHIGDDLKNDYEGAKAAGWHAVLVSANLTETPPAYRNVFKDLEALTLALQQDKLVL